MVYIHGNFVVIIIMNNSCCW